MSLYTQYKQSLKMIEAEELIDLFIFRPIGFIFVKTIMPLPLTPNHLSLLALLFGVIAGVFYAYGTREQVFYAGLFYLVYYILDISDGQLARLKKNGTPLGRIIDGFADYITHAAVYIGLGTGIIAMGGEIAYTWIVVGAALISMLIHAALMDYFRNRYLAYAKGLNSLYGDELSEYRVEFERMKKEGRNYAARIIFGIYLGYLKIQGIFSSSEKVDAVLKTFDKQDYLKRNRIVIRLWTMMGTGTHITLLIVTSFIYRLDIYLWCIITVINVYALFMVILQYFLDRATKKNVSGDNT
jgi:phosphatidylglycerophosphate synthase